MKKSIGVLSLIIIGLFLIGVVSSLEINSPISEKVYESRMVPLNLSFSEGDLEYARYSEDGVKYKLLCRDCDNYGYGRMRRKPFDDGYHKLFFFIKTRTDEIFSEVEFYVDSRKPRVFKTLPRRNKKSDGKFLIKYSEINLQNISLFYGVEGYYRKVSRYDCESGRRKNCEFNVDLEDFKGMEIYYWFEVSDFLRVVESRKTKVFVDGVIVEEPVEEEPEEPVEESNDTEVPEPGDNHNVGFINFTNSINGIRLEYVNGSDIIDNVLYCNQKYKIGVKVENQGDFVEDVYFNGSVGGLIFNHNPKLGLEIGGNSLKTKTVNFTLGAGFYDVVVEVGIDLGGGGIGVDVDLGDNVVVREVEVRC